jgi:hypothetical protein
MRRGQEAVNACYDVCLGMTLEEVLKIMPKPEFPPDSPVLSEPEERILVFSYPVGTGSARASIVLDANTRCVEGISCTEGSPPIRKGEPIDPEVLEIYGYGKWGCITPIRDCGD